MKIEDALKRIEELERRLANLENSYYGRNVFPMPSLPDLTKNGALPVGCAACRVSGICMCVRPGSGPQC